MKKILRLSMSMMFLIMLSACSIFNPKPEGTFELSYHASDFFNRSSHKYSDMERYDIYEITIDGDNYQAYTKIGESEETKSYLIKWGKNHTFTLQTLSFKTDLKDVIFHYDAKDGYLERIEKDMFDTHINVFVKDEKTKKHPPLGNYELTHTEGSYQGTPITEDYFKSGTLMIDEDEISIQYTYGSNRKYDAKAPYEASIHSIRLNLEDRYEVLIYNPEEKTLTFIFNGNLGLTINSYKLVFTYQK